MNWHTVDGGGHMTSAGGKFALAGTIGQLDAGLAMSGGGFQLVGGFWAIAVDAPSAAGDCNADGNVDLTDYATMKDCLSGPPVSVESAACTCFDLDGTGTVDLLDFAAFQVVWSYP
jgi:hypothetical protein